MYLDTREGAVYYEVHGSEDLPVIVFTHGAGLNSRAFDAQIAALKNNYCIIVWDMPGHGRSYKLDAPLNFAGQCDIIIGIMDKHYFQQAVLAGHSLGSWVSQHCAHKYPQRVKAIISIAGTPLNKPFGKLFIWFFKFYNEFARLIPEKSLYRTVARQKAFTPEAQNFYEKSLTEIGFRQNYLINKGMIAANGTIADPPTQPVLMIHGEHENPKQTAKINARWHADTPGSKYEVLQGAGHNGNQDNPEAFNEAVLSFLKSLSF